MAKFVVYFEAPCEDSEICDGKVRTRIDARYNINNIVDIVSIEEEYRDFFIKQGAKYYRVYEGDDEDDCEPISDYLLLS